jgi:hypothetical protein
MGDAATPPLARDLPRYAAIGLVAGLFSALFGVGGGIVIVPLLIGLLAVDAKVATATSLAAIVFTAAAGASVYAVLGRVQVDDALLIGIPACAGLLAGLWIKSRISSRALTLAFAAFLVVIAVRVAWA